MANNKMKSAVIAASFVAAAVAMLLIDRRNRANAGNWIDEMRDELTRRIKETKDITREKYEQIVDDMRPQYEAMKDVDAHEMNDLVDELKSHWKNISEETKKQMDSVGQGQKQKKTPA